MTTDQQQSPESTPEAIHEPEATQENNEPDKRQFPRAPFRLCVTLNGNSISGKRQARDISLDGIFVETKDTVAQGEDVQLSIPFSNHDRQIKMKGKVVRISDDGIGIQFDIYAIDIE